MPRALQAPPDPRLFSELLFELPEVRRPAPAEAVDVPVAPLIARAIAGAADATLVAGGCVVFFTAYALIGGKFPLHRAGLAAMFAAVVLLAIIYMTLFLYHSDATAGMAWLGLRLVDFDGNPARRERRVWRLFGILASASALGFGFWWAIADEDGLTWHDRISRTCLTMNGSTFQKIR